jgi:hypothetical protein
MSASYTFKESLIFVLLRLIINYTMFKAVCPSLALSHFIPSQRGGGGGGGGGVSPTDQLFTNKF